MNNKIKTTIIEINLDLNGVLLKGVLEYWAKDYAVKLLEPFEGSCTSHLQYAVPAIYVFEKSKNPTCHEIELKDISKEILKSIYLNKKNGYAQDSNEIKYNC